MTRIAVDGATGYLGNHVVAALRQRNIEVRCLVHPGAREADKRFLESTGAEIVQASFDQWSDNLKDAFWGCDAAIHLIGSIAPPKGQTLDSLHGAQTDNFVKATRAAGVQKLVHITALGTSVDAPSSYHRTKWLAEEHIRASGIPYIILRPSLIVGRRVGSRNSKLVTRYLELIRTRPRVPLIAGGNNKIQPIFVEDLAEAIVAAATDDSYNNKVFELGGPQVLTMKEFVQSLMQLEGKTKPLAAIPLAVAKVMATACEIFQDVPLISHDQIKLSSQDNICSDNALSTTFGIKPTSLDAALATYIGHKETVAGRS